jgi:hypothetical protein
MCGAEERQGGGVRLLSSAQRRRNFSSCVVRRVEEKHQIQVVSEETVHILAENRDRLLS